MSEDESHGESAGTTIRVSRGRVLQRQRGGVAGWTEAERAIFLDTLAESCNVRLSVAAAGVSVATAYHRRRVDAAFAAEWHLALTIGYERLEAELLRVTLEALTRVGEGSDPDTGGDTAESPRPGTGLPRKAGGSPDTQMALLLLNRHRATVEGGGKASAKTRRMTADETDALLRQQLDSLAKRLRAGGGA